MKGIFMIIKYCCTWLCLLEAAVCMEPKAWPLRVISPALSVVILGSRLPPFLPRPFFGAPTQKMTTWLVRLTVLL